METHKRSLTKSIIWRIVGVIVLALITYIVTRNWVTTSLVTVLHHGVFLVVYYLHERTWLKIKWASRWRSLVRMTTYEFILGNGILALITYSLTGSLQQMSLITFIYIGCKYPLYIVYDSLWGRVKWQIK